MNSQKYYAHTLEGKDEEKWQTVKEHAEKVAELVKKFSAPWCTEEYAENLGLLHDAGKYQVDFQRRLRGEGRYEDWAADAEGCCSTFPG